VKKVVVCENEWMEKVFFYQLFMLNNKISDFSRFLLSTDKRPNAKHFLPWRYPLVYAVKEIFVPAKIIVNSGK